MVATAGSVTVDCPECGDEITVDLRLHTLPRVTDGEPLFVELEPDHDIIRQHIEQAHSA